MDETMNLIQMAHEGDKAARDRLVVENMGLIWSIVRRFERRGHETEDLFQIGAIGLMKAVDHFDLDMGLRFSTYAVPMMTGEIKRCLRDDGMIKVSRSLKELGFRVNRPGRSWGEGLGGNLRWRRSPVSWGRAVSRWRLPSSRQRRWNPSTGRWASRMRAGPA